MVALLRANANQAVPSGTQMVHSANGFLETLTDKQKTQAMFVFDDPERLNWHFIPRPRKGLPLRDLEGEALKAAQHLIRSGLSEAGYDQALNVMSLEEVLFLLEKTGTREERRERRNPQKYYLSIFGVPTETGTWGWRVEGHHLSLNFVVQNGAVISSTPEFFGANPGTLDAGLNRTLRVLGPEEDLARSILKLCTAEQERLAYISDTAPDDLRGAGEAQPVLTPVVGLPVSQMSDDQKKLMQQLLTEYLQNVPEDVGEKRRAEINDAGIDKIVFAWWGGKELNERHYYRVQGPTFIIEYNNTQNNANHVHSMWRRTAGDFGISLNP